jgi:hypothetical protein
MISLVSKINQYGFITIEKVGSIMSVPLHKNHHQADWQLNVAEITRLMLISESVRESS